MVFAAFVVRLENQFLVRNFVTKKSRMSFSEIQREISYDITILRWTSLANIVYLKSTIYATAKLRTTSEKSEEGLSDVDQLILIWV